jgi:anti-sigma B factor antagonist
MGAELDIAVRRERGFVVVKATGVIDISTVSRLRERLFEQADAGRPLIVDLEQITFIDSAGLGALIGASRRAEEHGGTLHAVCARPHTRKQLCLTGVDRRIPLSSSLDGAVASIAAAREDHPATEG